MGKGGLIIIPSTVHTKFNIFTVDDSDSPTKRGILFEFYG